MNLEQLRSKTQSIESNLAATRFDIPSGTVIRARVSPRQIPNNVTDCNDGIGETKGGLRHFYFTLTTEGGQYEGVQVYGSLPLEQAAQPHWSHLTGNQQYAVSLGELAWVRAFEAASWFRNVNMPPKVQPRDLYGCEVCVQIGHDSYGGKTYKAVRSWVSYNTQDTDLAAAWHSISMGSTFDYLPGTTQQPPPAGVNAAGMAALPVAQMKCNGWAAAKAHDDIPF